MYIKELEMPGLELVDPNADYSGTQTIFIDFDGANGVSYDNDALNIHIDNLSVAHSDLSEEEQFQILTNLNHTFTVTAPTNEEYSTIYVGGNGSAFSETIAHEAAHLLGFRHEGDETVGDYINDYAWEDYMEPYQGGNERVNWHYIAVETGTYSFEVDNTPYAIYPTTVVTTTWYVNNVYKETDTTRTSDPEFVWTFGSGTTNIEASISRYGWLESHIWVVTAAYDNKAPDSVSNLDLQESDDTGSSNSDNITKEDDLRFTWSASSDNGVSGVESGIYGYYYSLSDSTPDSNDSFTDDTYCTFSNLSEGADTLYVSAVDKNGNVSSAKSILFTVDKTAPGAPILYSPNNGAITYDQTPYFDWGSVSGTDYYEIKVYDGDVSWGDISATTSSSSYTPSSNIPLDDTYYWKVRATDDAGNVGSGSSVRSFYLAGQPDLVTNDIKINNTSNLSPVTIYQGDEVTIDALFKNEGNTDSKSNVKYKWWGGTSSNDRNTQITDGNGNDIDGVVVTGNGFKVNEEEWISTYFSTLNSDPDNWVVNLDSGTYWLTYEIDNPNENDEGTNENNNLHSEQFVVIGQVENPPDAQFFISDYNEHAGPIGWYADTVKNYNDTGIINSGLK